jgi:hypothetical protein
MCQGCFGPLSGPLSTTSERGDAVITVDESNHPGMAYDAENQALHEPYFKQLNQLPASSPERKAIYGFLEQVSNRAHPRLLYGHVLSGGPPNAGVNTILAVELFSDGSTQYHEIDHFNADTVTKHAHLIGKHDVDTCKQTLQRLIVVPDLSPHIIALLGESFNIDPRVFQAHIEARSMSTHSLSSSRVFDAQADDPSISNEDYEGLSLHVFDCEVNFSATTTPRDHSWRVGWQETQQALDRVISQLDCQESYLRRRITRDQYALKRQGPFLMEEEGAETNYVASSRLTIFYPPAMATPTGKCSIQFCDVHFSRLL